jgi:hypothetical protein
LTKLLVRKNANKFSGGRNLTIKNEAEFILKIRNKYHKQVNNRTATYM